MTTASTTQAMPAAELLERAKGRQFRPGYAIATIIAAVCAGLGWLLGRGLVVAGWTAGKAWLACAYMAETFTWGFKQGSQPRIPLPDPPEKPPVR